MKFTKAEKTKARLRIGLVGLSKSGKTYGSLLIAEGLGGKVAVIDTERGRASYYADLFEFDVLELSPPFTTEKYMKAITTAEEAGYDIIIIDSISHEWDGAGGILEEVDKKTQSSASKNSYFAWSKFTPLHRKFVDAMLNSNCHIIATMRTKTEYALEKNDKGKIVPRKIGLAPIQRNGTDYEFPFIFNIDESHRAIVEGNQTLISFGDDSFLITKEVGKKFLKWLNTGAKMKDKRLEKKKKEFFAKCKESGMNMKTVTPFVQNVIGKNPKEFDLTIADYDILMKAVAATAAAEEKIAEKTPEAPAKEVQGIHPEPVKEEAWDEDPYCDECGQKIAAETAEAAVKNFGYPLCGECAQKTMNEW